MKLFRKFHQKFLILAVVFNVTAACTTDPSASVSKEPLRVEYTQWWGDYTVVIAQEMGFFEKNGVSVEPVYYETYSDSYSDLASGILDGGMFVLGDAININDKSPVKTVAVYDDGGSDYIVGAADVHAISDLKGKRIGVSINSAGELVVLQALKQGGLTITDVTLIDIPVEDIPANLGNTIDAGYTWDPYASEALANGAHVLSKSGGTKTLGPDVIVFNTNVLTSRPDDIRGFLKAWFEAVDYRNANPEKSNQMIADKLGLSLVEITIDSQMYTLQENIVLLSDQTPQDMINLTTAFNANVDFLLGLGVLSNQPDKNQFIDSSYLFQ